MPNNLTDLIKIFINLINLTLPVLAGVALLVFLWGLVKFIYSSGDAKGHEEGRKFMIWGVIGIFVMVSFMGIVAFFYQDLGFTSVRPFGIPGLPQ